MGRVLIIVGEKVVGKEGFRGGGGREYEVVGVGDDWVGDGEVSDVEMKG